MIASIKNRCFRTRMPIIFHPNPGQILLCDFSDFKEPEMVKKNRPVIVLSSALKGRDKLLTIVPLSTVKPEPLLFTT